MAESFSSDDFAEAGVKVMQAFDAMEDTDLQAHMLAARAELAAAARHLKLLGFPRSQIVLMLVGLAFAPVMDGEG